MTFKENVRDIRNSGSADVVRELRSFGIEVDIHDPLADVDDVRREYGFEMVDEGRGEYGALVLTVGHAAYQAWDTGAVESLLAPGGLVADIRGVWRDRSFSDAVRIWRL